MDLALHILAHVISAGIAWHFGRRFEHRKRLAYELHRNAELNALATIQVEQLARIAEIENRIASGARRTEHRFEIRPGGKA